MNWTALDSEEKLKEILTKSKISRVLIFKFQPRNIISILTRGLLERYWNSGEMEMDIYFLNAAEQSALSLKIESLFNIKADIPGILIIENEKCVYSAYSGHIDYTDIRQFSNRLNKIS